MPKNKKVILCVLLVLFIIIAIVAYILSTRTKPEKPIDEIKVEEKDRFGLVDEYEEFFSIQSTINDIEHVDMGVTYFAKEIYVNTKGATYYYFIKATKIAEFEKTADKFFLLILDKNTNYYELNEITDNITDLKLFAQNYNLQEVSIYSGNKLKSGNDSQKNILTVYLEYFKIMLIKDTFAAYNMLSDETKAKYVDFNDFDLNVINVYESLSSNIFSIGENKETDEKIKTYTFEDDNRNKIEIHEESIMNFKITY